MKVSKYFSRSEFACRCGCRFKTMDYELITNLETLADYFLHSNPEVTRIIIHINSGNRCKAYDKKIKMSIAAKKGIPYVKTKSTSQHVYGLAADFWMEYVYANGTRKKINDDHIADRLESKYIGRYGIGRYNGRTHYDIRTGSSARWDRRR